MLNLTQQQPFDWTLSFFIYLCLISIVLCNVPNIFLLPVDSTQQALRLY